MRIKQTLKPCFMIAVLACVLLVAGTQQIFADGSEDFIIEGGVLTKYTGDGGNVVVPNGVKKIGDTAFLACTGLTGITLPSGLTAIGEDAFEGCISLTSITIPDGVANISSAAFCECTGLTSITIPRSVTKIGDSAFWGCTSLTGITIPDTVTEIGASAFRKCRSLTNITIPNSVTKIGVCAFAECTGLTSVAIPNSMTEIEYEVFLDCTGLASITLPNSVTKIGPQCFWGCPRLKSVVIPETVTEAGEKPFGYYGDEMGEGEKVPGFTIYGYYGSFADNYAEEHGFAFVGNVHTKNGVMNQSLLCFTSDVVIPEGVTEIGDDVFSTTAIKSIKLPDTVKKIGKRAFFYCSEMTNITMPKRLSSIGENAFEGCGLTSVTIPDGVTIIPELAFFFCDDLTNVTIPDTVTKIGAGAFNACGSLKSITIPKSVKSIGDMAFGYDPNYKKVPGFTVYGYAGSAAEKYAAENKMKFKSLGSLETEPAKLTIKAQEKAILSRKSDTDPAGATYRLLQARMKNAKSTSITLEWKKVSGATKYVVYGNKCGKNNKYKKLKTLKKTSFTDKKLTKGTYYKYIVVAVKGNTTIATSKVIHAATTGGKAGNPKSVKLKKKTVSVKTGKTVKINATAVPASKKLKVKKHRAIAFESSNTNIAKVSSKGVVTGVSTGTCYVYVYAQNGVMAKATVKVS